MNDKLDYKISLKDAKFHLKVDEPVFKSDTVVGNDKTLEGLLRKLIPGEKYDYWAPVIVSHVKAQGEFVVAAGGKFAQDLPDPNAG